VDLKNGQNTGELENLRQSGKLNTHKKDDAKFASKQNESWTNSLYSRSKELAGETSDS
jgi:hypothetical protein